MEIKGKTAVITGAASGIGRAAARELVKHGVAAVALVDRAAAVEALAAEINAEARQRVARAYCGDTTDEKLRQRVYAELRAEFGPVNICVPAAGVTRDALAIKLN